MMTVQGRYTPYYVFDRRDFEEKMREGMPIAAYMEKEKHAGIRVVISPKYQAAKTRFIIFEYMINGSVVYCAHKVSYSIDILKNMMGKPCMVEYDPADPFSARIAGNDPIASSNRYSVGCFVTGLVSGGLGFAVIPSIILSIICIVLYGKSKKAYPDSPAPLFNILGLVFAIIGIVEAVVAAIIYIVILCATMLG